MKPATPAKPAFLWQGVLILLPVTLMAGLGFWAIVREHNAVEQEATQRAEETLRSLSPDFGRNVAGPLTQFEFSKDGWLTYLQWSVAPWPGTGKRGSRLVGINESRANTNDLAGLRAVFPQWPAGPVPLLNFLLNTNGDPLSCRPAAPRPPEWLVALSPAQFQAWTAFPAAASAGEYSSNLTALAKAFQRTDPPVPALACAEFLTLRARTASMNATNAINQLIRFAARHDDVIADSGVPLPTLALAEALLRARDSGLTAPLWHALQTEVASPSALTPSLLDEAGRLAGRNNQLSAAVQAMRTLLADKTAQTELADALAQNGKTAGLPTTSLWVNAMGQHWFCLLASGKIKSGSIVSNQSVWKSVPVTEADCYSQPLLSRAFADALEESHVSLPAYFRIFITVEGQPVPLPAPWGKSGPGQPSGELLAEAPFLMSQPVGMAQPDPATLQSMDISFEEIPSHPRSTLQIRLTDRSLLYARQRQLQWIFGTLVAASALAAFIGFIAAYRAFRRQQELNDLKSSFVSSVSHELRAPIASVRLMAENLASGKIPEALRQREYFDFIVQECRRLSSLIENVLDFSRIEQGRKEYEFEPTNLTALVQSTVTLMEPYAREKGVALQFESADPASVIESKADGRALQQALVNLLDNAIKHSAHGQTVTVGLELQNELPAPVIHLFVADAGPGIPPAEHEKIFERFYRLGSELRRETQGIGIGLSIVKHIVAAHGGRVTVQSAPGCGSRFTIELPLNPMPEGGPHE